MEYFCMFGSKLSEKSKKSIVFVVFIVFWGVENLV